MLQQMVSWRLWEVVTPCSFCQLIPKEELFRREISISHPTPSGGKELEIQKNKGKMGTRDNHSQITLKQSFSALISITDTGGWISLYCGAALGIAGCLAASLASTHKMPVAPLQSCDDQNCLHTFPNVLRTAPI